jgi:MFS family permease
MTCKPAGLLAPGSGKFGAEALPFIVGLGTMFVSAHVSGINVVFPQIISEFGVSIAKGQWILTAYTLSISACLLTFGSLADRIGLLRVYIWGMALFGVSSGACTLASGESALIVLRVIQGVGGAMVSATSVALIGQSIATCRLGRAVGWQTGMTYIGLTLGPVVAGFGAQRFGWRIVFAINVPAAILTILVARRAPAVARKCSDSENRPEFKFMLTSVLMWMSGVVAFIISSNGRTGRVFAAAWVAICLFFFLGIDARSPHPLLGRWTVRNREFAAAALGEAIYYMCLHAVGFLLPIYLLRGRGYTTAHVGLLLGSQSAARTVLAPLSGRASDRFGANLPLWLGIVALGLAVCGLCLLTNETAPWAILACLILLGAGAGLFAPANSKVLLCAAPPGKQGISTGILATARNAGMTFGVGFAALLFSAFGGDDGANSLDAVRVAFAVIAGIAILHAALCIPFSPPQLGHRFWIPAITPKHERSL